MKANHNKKSCFILLSSCLSIRQRYPDESGKANHNSYIAAKKQSTVVYQYVKDIPMNREKQITT